MIQFTLNRPGPMSAAQSTCTSMPAVSIAPTFAFTSSASMMLPSSARRSKNWQNVLAGSNVGLYAGS